MEDITFKIPLTKLVSLVLAEQKYTIKKYLTDLLGQQAGDLIDKYVSPEEGIVATLNSLAQ